MLFRPYCQSALAALAALLGLATALTAADFAPPSESLGPSTRRTPLTFSEVHYHPTDEQGAGDGEFVELYNSQPWAIPLKGYELTGGIQFRFPDSATIPAQGFVVIAKNPSQLQAIHGLPQVWGPFSGRLNDGGDSLYLRNGSGAVLLEVEYEDTAPWPPAADGMGSSLILRRPSYHENNPLAWSASQTPGGTPGSHEPLDSLPQPASIPQPAEAGNILFNEIMFHPISGNTSDEYVELYNRGSQAVDLSDWRIEGGIRLTLPIGRRLLPDHYLVVAKDIDALRTTYPHLDASNSIGNFAGQLSNRGERLRLIRPGATADAAPTIIDTVHYWDHSRQSRWADGGGSSLELRDPRSDNDHPASWADSDESEKAPWTEIDLSLEALSNRRVNARTFQILHLGAGDCVIDDLWLSEADGENQVLDGTFEEGTDRWRFQGNHVRSEIRDDPTTGGKALFLQASGRGDPHSNRLQLENSRTRLSIPAELRLRARVRWLRGFPEILFRLHRNYGDTLQRLELPPQLGTPGRQNSRWEANTGPLFRNVTHAPVLPQANESVTVSAAVQDPDGIETVRLLVREDTTDAPTQTIPMLDDGTSPDRQAGDGIYTAAFDGLASGRIAAFRIVATDGQSVDATYPHPDPSREALIRFGDPEAPAGFGNYRIWYTRETLTNWTDRNRTPASNESLPVTFIYNNERIFYDIGATYSGSFFNSPNYTTPTGSPSDYVVRFPGSERFLGASRIILSWPGLTGIPDPTLQREQTAYWMAGQLGLPFNYRRYVSVFVAGRRRGILMEDTQRPNGDMVNQWYPEDADGDLYKIQVRYESDSQARTPVESQPASLTLRVAPDGSKRPTDYRWNWTPQNDDTTLDQFGPIFALVDAVNQEDDRTFLESSRAAIDIDQWMRTLALENLIGNWDSFGYGNGQNMYAYKPRNQGWQLMIWDLDIGLGSSIANSARTPLFQIGGAFVPGAIAERATIGRMYQTPEFARAYYRACLDALEGPFNETAVNNYLQPRLEALSAASGRLRVQNPTSILSYVRTRGRFVQDELDELQTEFAITKPMEPAETSTPNIVISGTAPIRVAQIQLNGFLQPVDWTDVTTWRFRYTLRTPNDRLELAGLDRNGNPVSEAGAAKTVRYTGTTPLPQIPLWINEWMADNQTTVADPADGDFDDWIEIYNSGTEPIDLSGYSLTDDPAQPDFWQFPPNTRIAGNSFLLVWADGEPEQTQATGDLHSSFRLNAAGETISLYSPTGLRVDQVQFGRQEPDQSQARLPDGGTIADRNTPLTPTPGTGNQVGTELRITGWQRLADGQWEVIWSSIPGRRYRVQVSETLTPNQWQNLGSSVEATGSTTRIELTLPSDSTPRFIRIQREDG